MILELNEGERKELLGRLWSQRTANCVKYFLFCSLDLHSCCSQQAKFYGWHHRDACLLTKCCVGPMGATEEELERGRRAVLFLILSAGQWYSTAISHSVNNHALPQASRSLGSCSQKLRAVSFLLYTSLVTRNSKNLRFLLVSRAYVICFLLVFLSTYPNFCLVLLLVSLQFTLLSMLECWDTEFQAK